MKHFVLFIALFFSFQFADAQCPGCLISSTCGDATPGTRLPNLCPSVLPDGTVGVAYSQDVTIWIPQTFTYSGVAVTIMHVDVLSVTSLPAGLALETSLGAIPVSFDVTGDMRLCAKICGTPTVPGTRTVQLNVAVTVNTPIGIQTQNQAFPIPITINPPAGGNASFTYATKFACDSTIDTFHALLENPPYPVTYQWDFDNDGTIDDSNRTTQPIVYNTPGEHYVKLTTNFLNYRITRVSVNDINAATWYWHEFCGDGIGVTIFGIPLYTQTSDADLSMTLTDGTNVYNGSEQSNNDAPVWNFSIPFNPTPGVINVSFYESDGICGGQSGGVATTTIHGAGVYSFATIGGAGTVTGRITVESYIESSIETIDTITIYESPAAPILMANVDTFCSDDSVNLYIATPTSGLSIEWYKDDVLMTDYVDSSIWVKDAANYKVKVSNINGCSTWSAVKKVVSMPAPPAFVSLIQLAGRKLVNTNYPGSGFVLQWYKDGVLLTGENGVMIENVTDGNYTLEIYNPAFPHCSRMSAPFAFNTTGIDDHNYSLLSPVVYPNPSNGNFTLKVQSNMVQDIHCTVYDMMGQIFMTKDFLNRSGLVEEAIDASALPSGVYFLKVESGNNAYQIKLVIK